MESAEASTGWQSAFGAVVGVPLADVQQVASSVRPAGELHAVSQLALYLASAADSHEKAAKVAAVVEYILKLPRDAATRALVLASRTGMAADLMGDAHVETLLSLGEDAVKHAFPNASAGVQGNWEALHLLCCFAPHMKADVRKSLLACAQGVDCCRHRSLAALVLNLRAKLGDFLSKLPRDGEERGHEFDVDYLLAAQNCDAIVEALALVTSPPDVNGAEISGNPGNIKEAIMRATAAAAASAQVLRTFKMRLAAINRFSEADVISYLSLDNNICERARNSLGYGYALAVYVANITAALPALNSSDNKFSGMKDYGSANARCARVIQSNHLIPASIQCYLNAAKRSPSLRTKLASAASNIARYPELRGRLVQLGILAVLFDTPTMPRVESEKVSSRQDWEAHMAIVCIGTSIDPRVAFGAHTIKALGYVEAVLYNNFDSKAAFAEGSDISECRVSPLDALVALTNFASVGVISNGIKESQTHPWIDRVIAFAITDDDYQLRKAAFELFGNLVASLDWVPKFPAVVIQLAVAHSHASEEIGIRSAAAGALAIVLLKATNLAPADAGHVRLAISNGDTMKKLFACLQAETETALLERHVMIWSSLQTMFPKSQENVIDAFKILSERKSQVNIEFHEVIDSCTTSARKN